MNEWSELSVVIPREAAEEVSALLFHLGAEGVQEDFLPGERPPPRQPWDEGPEPEPPARLLIKGWWPAEATEGLVETLRECLEELEGAEVSELAAVSPNDWAESWKANFTRMPLAPGLTISPPWMAEPDDIIIEPGMAFGTGDHPSTRACLIATHRLARPGARCLDVGTGSGVIALVAARAGMDAWGIDIDPECIRASLENAARNMLTARFDETPLAEVPGTFELVVANVFAEVLIQMAPDFARLCAGDLVLAGILADRADRVVAALEADFTLLLREQTGEWVSLELRRRGT